MDSDLPLLQISSDDDDSLLHNNTLSPLPHFSSSFTTSTISVSKINEDSSGLSSSIFYNNKENVDVIDSKSGTPNLSIQPQRMKKGKKGGGYNLRKSLAWDRAFFSEEGVLNSIELSMITGTPGELIGDSLSVINEHRTDLNSNSVGGLCNPETLEEDLFQELPSGNLDGRNAASMPYPKQDSLTCNSLPCGSKRIPPRNDVSKTALKGRVTSSPMASASQKRLLNMGSKKVMTRSSKIPKYPALRQDSCLPPMIDTKIPKFTASKQNASLPSKTSPHTGPSGSGLKSNRISQSAVKKNMITKVSLDTKSASSAVKVSSDCTSKSSKPSAENAKNDMAIPKLDMNLSTNQQAQPTTNRSILAEMASSKGPPTGGTYEMKSIDRISKATVSSYFNSNGAGRGINQDLQSHGNKPSGLRMPSPSLRFFSEPKAPLSNASLTKDSTTLKPLKSSTPTLRNQRAADHNQNLKPPQLLQGEVNFDATGKSSLSSQKIENCSTLSILDPTANFEVIRDEEDQQGVRVQIPPGDKALEQPNKKRSRSQVLSVSHKCCMSHVPNLLKYKEGDRKDDIVSAEATHRTSITSQIGDGTRFENSFGSSCDLLLNCSSETVKEVQRQLVEDIGHKSSVKKDMVMPGFPINSVSENSLTLAADNGTSRNIFCDDKLSDENNMLIVDASKTIREVQPEPVKDTAHNSTVMNDEIMPRFQVSSVSVNSFTPAANRGTSSTILCDQEPSDQTVMLIMVASESIREVEPEMVEDIGQNSLATNGEVMPGFQINSNSDNNLPQAADGETSRDLHDDNPSDQSNISSFIHLCNSGSMDVQIDAGNSFSDGTSTLKLNEADSVALVCNDREVADEKSDGGQLYNSFDNEDSISCCTNCVTEQSQSLATSYHRPPVNKEGGHTTVVKESPTMNVNECLEASGDARGKDYQLLTSGNFFFEHDEFSLKSNKLDQQDRFNQFSVSPEVQANRGHDLKKLAEEGVVQVNHTFMTSKCEPQSHPCEYRALDSSVSDLSASATDTINANTSKEEHVTQNELPEKEPVTQNSVPDLTGSLLIGQSTPKTQDERHAGISGDEDKVGSSSEKIDPTDSATLLSHGVKDPMDGAFNLEFHSSAMESKDQMASPPVAVSETERSFSSDDRHELEPGADLDFATLYEHIESNKYERGVSPREPETSTSQDFDGLTSENICRKEDRDSKLITYEDGEKLTRPASILVPFSDEWLAAIEAAGEEILTMKSGAVQNSPPDKSIPEPSPWSPVKKKSNQGLGPFDCTKYRNPPT